ncbi:Uncharacterised protein [Klebsiella pneumoniae]|nr:Uncharacterised protein [Klebsiella pneumoniae]SBK09261.1 Uncharacterised protein [Klebsiella pneumoniae]SBL48308.1 Uncharacterised protein [Klebsiella pneumoniae]SVX68969.1 Uncharacterised protein [Klebsiella pneumoniae]SVZ11701.1 Uncharacterised protein [Klebsiella pneumoniae]
MAISGEAAVVSGLVITSTFLLAAASIFAWRSASALSTALATMESICSCVNSCAMTEIGHSAATTAMAKGSFFTVFMVISL